ncbi:ribonuclease Y [Candidatus Parcubacteria bacterium]|nr:ribonuclease Y [Candidatus Parcubacteria bacterium]
MTLLISLLVGIVCLAVGSFLGYYARQSIAKKQIGSLEEKIQKKIAQAKKEAEELTSNAKEKSSAILESVKKEEDQRRRNILKTEQVLLRRENILDRKISDFEDKEKEFHLKVEKLKQIKENLENYKKEIVEKLEKISKLSQKEAEKELLKQVEKENELEILERMRNLEREGMEKFEKRAKEILASAIQKCSISQAQEITTTNVSLPNDEIKGRIIGKEGRNIRTLESLTGVEIVVDETPGVVVISGFDPVRRQIAKTALDRLIQDGRIQPVKIEEAVSKAEEEIVLQIKEAGEQAVYETGIVGLNPKIIQLLGRLRFRTSYGQNVLLHSIEVSHLAGALASEIGANAKVAREAGLLHDIGKALDWKVEGSHTEIGIKILEKFGIEKEVIDAMKSHHGEYAVESIEAVLVQTADAISGARPGARKDTVENYLKRLGELEDIANAFSGVEKAWALQAGREIRVFVRPEEVDDLAADKLAREIAKRIQEELRYPGEIKVTLIREKRVIEYAK